MRPRSEDLDFDQPELCGADFDQCLRLIAWSHRAEVQRLQAENLQLKERLGDLVDPAWATSTAEAWATCTQAKPAAPAHGGLVSMEEAAVKTASIEETVVKTLTLPGSVDYGGEVEMRPTMSSELGEVPADAADHASKSPREEGVHRFKLSRFWTDPVQVPRGAKWAAKRRSMSLMSTRSQDTLPAAEGRCAPIISYPNSSGRLVWDVIGAVLILYDLLEIPLVAFDPPQTPFVIAMNWLTLIFWTLNMPMSIQVGFVRDGVTIMEFDKICINYLRTWFALDLAVVLPDWVFTIISLSHGTKDSASNGFKLLRVLRLVRMVRLLRLLKLGRLVRSLNDLIETEYTNIFANIAKMIVLLLVINHYIACLWFLLGTAWERDDTWVVFHRFNNRHWGSQYLAAFHWAITQFTPSSMHVQPQNSIERSFAILVVIFALVGFSYTVGSITGSLSQLRSMHEERYKQFWMMRRYLKHNHVPLELCSRINRHLEHAWNNQQQTVSLKDSKIFSLLSEQLQSELRCGIWMPYMRVHELFAELSEVNSMTLHRIARTAMLHKSLAPGDLVFQREKAMYTYIIMNGRLGYLKQECALSDKPIVISRSEDFIAEPVLWTPHWSHLGELAAIRETEVLTLDPRRFVDILRRSPDAFAIAAYYGSQYVEMLNATPEQELSDVISFKKPRLTESWTRKVTVQFSSPAVWS